ncbi:hypothetical protein SDRG_06814 [Saprolegnia diclina VS20]|uniref:Uncharacterized protein n=1 Tax=Saprolegnia diclina (strain VS20) TaxID=1156394 RepID=T0RT03_SAPDV|nr:hypothetical protein SDRG_06814 [Saprolegnia diclina VS20]EQC35523.1 hypothetical protein SDRG_06814 [Saprolegnia diclina VS20]|eukprot:XP_008610840.1 hypothetical protein SDRG_06814 [Saprolegnia diclina VS20]
MASEASRLYKLQNNLLDGMSMQAKLIAGLSVLFLFLSFLIWLTWDRYGKEVSALYEGRSRFSNAPAADGDDDEFKAYKSLPTFFYEYNKKKK